MSLFDFIAVNIIIGFLFVVVCGIASFWIPSLSLFNAQIWINSFTSATFILLIYIALLTIFIKFKK
tara:strand:+ start:100 stop:297 length:198 start_codon:yes stop_codon:yes gene_type:complete